MHTLSIIILFGLLMSGIAVIGGITLILREETWQQFILPLVAFAAGSLVGGAILHMIPAAVDKMGNVTALYLWLVAGFMVFYALEEFLHWHHSHTHSHKCSAFASPQNHQHPTQPASLHVHINDQHTCDFSTVIIENNSDESFFGGNQNAIGDAMGNDIENVEPCMEGSTGTDVIPVSEEKCADKDCGEMQFQETCDRDDSASSSTPELTWLILVADAVHNFLGGMFVGASFLDSTGLGLSAWLAAAAHEVPQELGDFAILVHGGWSKQKALMFNFISALTFPIGGVVAYLASRAIDVSFLIPFAAGNFLYIGASDLIPEIKHHHGTKRNIVHFMSFVVGVGIMLVIRVVVVGW